MINYQGQSAELPLVVVGDEGSPVFVQNWLGAIKLNWRSIEIVSIGLDELLDKYLIEELSTDSLILRQGAVSKFC